MTKREWLATLKGGDHITLVCGSWSGEAIIERMTRTVFHTGSRSFNRISGLEVGENIPPHKLHHIKQPEETI